MIRVTITDNLDTVVATTSYETARPVHIITGLTGWTGDGPGVRAQKVLKLTNGAVPERILRTGRQLTVSGVSVLEDRYAVWGCERALSGLFSDGRQGTLAVDLDGYVCHAGVQLDGPAKIDANTDNMSVQWELALFAPDPYIYGPAQTLTLTPQGTGGGLQYPLHQGTDNGLVYDGSTGEPAAMLTNTGTADAWPTFTVTGDFASGFRVQVGTAAVEYPYPVFRQAPVTVDMAGHVWIGDTDHQADLTLRQWAPVPAGGAAQALFQPLQANGVGFCTVTVCDTYI